jgi:hypothetical protein
MINADPQTEVDLREAVRLATSHAADAYGAEGITEFGEIPREQFVARCHEGFDLAQKLILKNVLALEKKLKVLRADIKQRSKGKKTREIERDQEIMQLSREESEVVAIANAFRRVADTMAWQILGMNKVLMRSTHTGHGSRGYLTDTNIESLVEAIEQLRKPGEFYLINDLTLYLGAGAGDLLEVHADRSCGFVEVKSGAQNVRIFEFLHEFGERSDQQRNMIEERKGPRSPEECHLHQFMDANSDLLTEKNNRKQIGRIVRQMDRMHEVLQYDRTNIGKDLTLTASGKPVERMRVSHVSEANEEYAFAEIHNLLASVSDKPPYFSFLKYGPLISFLISDNTKSQTFATSLSPFVRMMNAKHMIYHHLHDNREACGYRKGPKEGAEELNRYAELFVLDWATQIVRDGSLVPPFIMPLGPEFIFDLICGRKSLFVYFERSAFADFVNEISDGKFIVKVGTKVDQEWSGLEIVLPDKKEQQGQSMIGWGFIFRMLMEFQDPDGVRRALVEMMQGQEKFAAEIERLKAGGGQSSD